MRKWLPVAAGVLVAVPLGIAQVTAGAASPLSGCLEQLASADPEAAAPAADPDAAEDESADPDKASGPCALRRSPESFAELANAHNAVAQRVAADSTADYAAAARQRIRLAEST